MVALDFGDGSVATLVYTGRGASGAGKERVEVFAGGAAFVLDDFRSLAVFGLDQKGLETRSIEKGQAEQLENFHRRAQRRRPLGVTAEDGRQATWCAEMAVMGTTG